MVRTKFAKTHIKEVTFEVEEKGNPWKKKKIIPFAIFLFYLVY